jgi:RecB family exonuclease
LTDKMVTVSNSEVETYRQCRLKHQLQYIERWRTDEEHEALSRGTLFHKVMEAHYSMIKEGHDHTPSWIPTAEDLALAVAPLLFEEGTGAQSERQELVEWMYRGYVDCYGIDDGKKLLAPHGPFNWEIVGIEVPLNFPLGPGFDLAGTADLIVRDKDVGSGLWIVDHKTCKDLPKKDFDLEDQTAVYAYLLKRAGYDIRGAIYNHVRTYKLKTREMEDDERFKRQMTVRTDQELETCAREVLELMQEAYGNHDRRTRLSYNDAGDHLPYDAPRSPDGERCGWKCNLTEACIAGRKHGPERTRSFLQDIGFTVHETKPGPTFNKEVVA